MLPFPGRGDRCGARAFSAAWSFVHLVVVTLVMSTSTPASAASPRFTRLSVEQGLSQSSVESIAEDRYGFLWFGTQEGLNRFDGYEFTVYQASAQPGRLRDSFIRAIVPDQRGGLWIGTLTGLQYLDVTTGRFGESVTPAAIGVRLNAVRVASDGRVWFVARNGELWTHSPQEGKTQAVNVPALGTPAAATAIAIEPTGRLWVAAAGSLLALEPRVRGEAISVASTHRLDDVGSVRVIHLEDGSLWVGRHNAPPLRYDPRSGEVTNYPHLPKFTLAFSSAGAGRLWIGARDSGLTRFDPKTHETVTYRHEPGNEGSLAENDVAAIHQDRGGSLWLGAWNGGLSRLNLDSQAFRTLRNTPGQNDSLPDNDVTRMAEGPDGRLWSITRNDVLSFGDPKSGSFAKAPFDADFTSIAFAGRDLFLGTATGLVEIDQTTGTQKKPREAIRAAGFDRAPIDAMVGVDQHLWVITQGNLYLLNVQAGGRSTQLRLPLDDDFTAIHAVSATQLWISYEQGSILRVSVVNGALQMHRYADRALADRGRLSAIAEQRGVVWVGAARGIGRLDPADGRVDWIDLGSATASRSVASIVADDAGVLWCAMEKGLIRFEPRTKRVVHFGAVQGAQASGYVDGGALRGASGLIYLAGRGITVFDPRRVVTNPHQPRVVFTELEILHRPVLPQWMDHASPLRTALHAANEVSLGPDAVVFSVEMAALGAADPEGVRFVHRLDGFDRDWIETTADRRVATYTRLAPGSYLLRARARTRSGVWSAEEATLRIVVLPPWWRTPAAIALWIAIALLVLIGAVREMRRRTLTRIALAEQEALRRASVTDPLTGLYNRRFLTVWMKHEVARALRTHRRTDAHPEFLLFVMADLDNLKRINDESGHDAGDRAIQAVADLLQSHARVDDIAVRWGGDEFLLVLRSVEHSQAALVVERLRRQAEQASRGEGDSRYSTISLGFASYPFLADDVEALTWEQTLQIADRALIQSKRRGRNAWTGFIATAQTSAAAVLHYLDGATDRSASAVMDMVEGPQSLPDPPIETSESAVDLASR